VGALLNQFMTAVVKIVKIYDSFRIPVGKDYFLLYVTKLIDH
jgi:hypothetical protein